MKPKRPKPVKAVRLLSPARRKSIATKIVKRIFRNDVGEMAERLVLMNGTKDLGGWGYFELINFIDQKVLKLETIRPARKKRTNTKLGQRMIAGLATLRDDLRSGKPIKAVTYRDGKRVKTILRPTKKAQVKRG